MISKIAQIKITTPCSEDWAGMTITQKGKHCQKCEKPVVDFTRMSDNGIVEYLRKNQGTCGRFYEHQLERDFMLVPEKTVWKKQYAGIAAGLILISQLWSKRTEAKTAEVTPFINNLNNLAVAADSIEVMKSFKGKIDQPDNVTQKAIKLSFHIKDFRMEFVCDSSKSTDFNFQIPDSLKNETIKVELFTVDSIVNFDILPSADFQNRQLNNFYYNDGWHQLVLSELLFNDEINIPWGPNIIMGIPPPVYEWIKPVQITYESVLSGLVTIDSSVINQTNEEEKTLKLKYENDKLMRKAGMIKKNNWSWWWLVFVVTLSAAIRWFFGGFKEKESQHSE